MTNSEARPDASRPNETAIGSHRRSNPFDIRISDFLRHSDFDIRHSHSSPTRARGRPIRGALTIGLAALLLAISGCGPSRLEQLMESARSEVLDEQRTALREIADLGPAAAPAVPQLIDLSGHRHPDIRRLSGLALGQIAASPAASGETPPEKDEIIEVLNRQLDDEEPSVRLTAAFALLDLDPTHTAAQQLLQRAMRQGDGGIVDRLTHTDPPPTWAVPTLIDLLEGDPRPGLRRLAAVALGNIAPNDPAARDALKKAASDSDDRVRSAAGEALNGVAR